VRYAETLTVADRHAVYKQCLKETADNSDISVTFMAKSFGRIEEFIRKNSA